MCEHTVEINVPLDSAIVQPLPPVNSAANSTRCAKAGCGKWAMANSRFCKDHQG
ncbi:hypothetical protein QM012_009053 [Aureobasidium pullulans]|uniref:Uncharacterized protein n=1 Tax=Aureobasidium pullulans TaxID=5580 RepID=A0ABR0TIE7_AURPU